MIFRSNIYGAIMVEKIARHSKYIDNVDEVIQLLSANHSCLHCLLVTQNYH